jgi:hypothetical protein
MRPILQAALPYVLAVAVFLFLFYLVLTECPHTQGARETAKM